MEVLSSIFSNRRLGAQENFFGLAEQFLAALASSDCAVRFEGQELSDLALAFYWCRTQTNFEKMLTALQMGKKNPILLSAIARGDRLTALSQVGLKILDGCRVQCQMCSEEARPEEERDSWQLLSLEDIAGLAPVFAEMDAVNISGGEPCDHPHLIQICQYLASMRVPFTINSSGGELETLKALLPYLKDGSCESFTLSVNDQYGELGQRRSSQTAAFLIGHNIHFIVNFLQKKMELAPGTFATPIDTLIPELERMGVKLRQGVRGSYRGRNTNDFYSGGFHYRDPLVRLCVSPVYPSGKATYDPDAVENAGIISEYLKARPFARGVMNGDVRRGVNAMCSFEAPTLRADGTVSPCASVMEGGRSGVPRLMDHLPGSVEELAAAMDRYRRDIMEQIWEAAQRTGMLPCFWHRQYGTKKNLTDLLAALEEGDDVGG